MRLRQIDGRKVSTVFLYDTKETYAEIKFFCELYGFHMQVFRKNFTKNEGVHVVLRKDLYNKIKNPFGEVKK